MEARALVLGLAATGGPDNWRSSGDVGPAELAGVQPVRIAAELIGLPAGNGETILVHIGPKFSKGRGPGSIRRAV